MTGTFFGDFDVEDALDTEPADPEQVARRLHRIRGQFERLAGRRLGSYDDLDEGERHDLEFAAERITVWVHEHPPEDLDDLGQAVHESGRRRHNDDRRWDDLGDDERELARGVGRIIGHWLIRQGAWR